MKPKVKLAKSADELRAQADTWLDLGQLRELVRMADDNGWTDSCLVSHSLGAGHHPRLRGMEMATYLIVEGPS